MADGFSIKKANMTPEELEAEEGLKKKENLEIIRNYAGELIDYYRNDAKQRAFNLLLLGEHGSGKSFIARTAQKPVLMDSFDPGGIKGLDEWIQSGEIIPGVQWESENPMYPEYWEKWLMEMDKRRSMGLFDHIGTYWLDSATTWSEAIMNSILKKAGIAGNAPRFTKDYNPQKVKIRNAIREALDLPCSFVLTGHLEQFDDKEKGIIRYRFLTTGQGTVLIPLLFDEIWVMDPREASNGVEYRVLTQSTGAHVCRSRISAAGKLDQYEKPDIKAILKKCGLEYKDKPLLS